MAAAGSFDEVIEVHEAYLLSIQLQCFLAPVLDKLPGLTGFHRVLAGISGLAGLNRVLAESAGFSRVLPGYGQGLARIWPGLSGSWPEFSGLAGFNWVLPGILYPEEIEVIEVHEASLLSIQLQCFLVPVPDKLWALIACRINSILTSARLVFGLADIMQ
nr:gamma-tubulin complex component 5 isoform X3 [Tanacetum cinerariifolium]